MFCIEMQDSRLPESDLEAIGCLQENKYIPAWLDATFHDLSPQLILSPIKFRQVRNHPFKGQLISKTNCHAEDSSKKRTNQFVFTSMRRVFVRFFEESSSRKKTFRDYLTFKHALDQRGLNRWRKYWIFKSPLKA